MYFEQFLKDNYDEVITLFIDMDGVIVDYNIFGELEFKDRRPLLNSINNLKRLIDAKNITLKILSVCRYDRQIKDKNDWLDTYASFFEKENRYIISKEKYNNVSSADLKVDFLKKYKTDNKVILIDDDNFIIKKVNAELPNIDVYQDSILVD